jgi:voltage-gated potassium channel
MTRLPLSAVLITRNCASSLAATLASLSFCDEIVVVDSGSDDGTRELALAHGAQVHTREWSGFGPQKRLAVSLASHDWVLAIDSDEAALETQRERTPGLVYLGGDASDDELLLSAGIMDAHGLFAVTGDDSRNLMIVFTAKQLNPKVRIVARCHEVRNAEKLRKAGADSVISPDFTGGMRIASSMIRPHVVSFLDEMLRSEHKLRLEEVPVPERFEPRALETLRLRSPNYVLLAVRKDGEVVFNPTKEFMLAPGQLVIAMASPLGRQELESALLPD